MKKRYILTVAGIFAAAAVSVAGCGGIGGDDDQTSSPAETTETTTEETESVTTVTTTSETTEAETTKEEETTEDTQESESVETVTAYGEGDSSGDTPASYSLEVKQAADGFEKSGDLTYSSDSAEYSYSIFSDATSHEIEAKLDNEASSLSDADTGRIGDVMYACGKTDFGYNVTAYRYIGAGSSVSAYAGIQYLSENEVSPSDVAALLSDEFISY